MNTCHLYTEDDLLLKIAGGDSQAFRVLYNLYRNKLYGFLYQLTKSHSISEDLLQDVFMRIWEDRDGLAEIRDLKAYVFI